MEVEVKKPIKRDPNLVPLSREHHHGLLFAWKIKQGLVKGSSLEIIRDYVLYFWKNSLREHLDAEEKMLLHILPEDDKLQQQLLREHALIRDMIKQIHRREELSNLLFEGLHLLLTEHIRFEERIFFPHLELHANPGQLTAIGKHLTDEHITGQDNYQPEFWARSKN